ncbi:hypothetical protein DENSPDRAFT_840327 [Dentipellis sp. KUC8613]|nr:hypothetical protein DENSPDRAFT_840327 [Dentipellis sp. KUC8613]
MPSSTGTSSYPAPSSSAYSTQSNTEIPKRTWRRKNKAPSATELAVIQRLEEYRIVQNAWTNWPLELRPRTRREEFELYNALSVLDETYDTLDALYRANEECAAEITVYAATNYLLFDELQMELVYLEDMANWLEQEEEGVDFLYGLDEAQMEALAANLAEVEECLGKMQRGEVPNWH